MTAEELKKQLESDLRIVSQYLEIKRRSSEGRAKPNVSTLAAEEHGRNGSSVDGAPYGIIGPAVANAIKRCGKKYNVRDIRKWLLKDGKSISTGQIATALRRFERQGKIKEVERGSGRRPNKYSTISL